ncbi:AraC family transcriptional regulator [Limnohabitans sp. 103DPR2]|uniref:AraC family transcriptional regulator n=1 Tax=Limnohabitans sp. 103DPR2 TaxID=1678129 RepID=UPI0006DCCFF9|nr:AraC family transcriptional regulator [Limnohabitans sp. 103DPR2]ALK90450.1 Urease operon transcriptional activator [Limnohabitans sp. 103DPR2]
MRPSPAKRPPVAATPMAFVQAILRAYAAQNKSPSKALEFAQITPSQAKKSNAHITALQMERISSFAMHELDDEVLGCLSRQLPWGTYGMLVRASLTSPTLGVALKRWCRHHGLVTDDIKLSVEELDGKAHIRLRELKDLGAQREFGVLSILRNLYGVACWLIDSRITLEQVQFAFEAPAHQAVYPLMFQGPVQFGHTEASASDHAVSELVMNASYLELPLRRDEAALQRMLETALTLTVLQYRKDRLLLTQVKQALAMHPQDTHSAEDLAPLLNLSPRSLHRQLKEEGTSLQVLKDEVRRERAIELLQRTRKPVKQVAESAGFQNEKSFIRAFKRWTGQTPAAFRDARHRSGKVPM